MSLYDFIRSVFGLHRPHVPADPSISDPSRGNEFKKPVWIDEYVEEDDDILSQRQSSAMFPVLSDPLEIHRYFEQQMEYMQQMLRNFSRFPDSSFFDDKHKDVFGAIAPPDSGSHNLRDEYLKKPDGATPSIRRDTDLDHKIGTEGLGGILDETSPEQQLVPAIPAPKFRFFGESIITKTVRKADGTVETRTTTRRSDGTEETTVSVQTPDGSEHTNRGMPPSGGLDILSGPAEDRFFSDLFDGFFRRN